MTDNFKALCAAHTISHEEIAHFSFNAIEASFASAERKQQLTERLQEFLSIK